ncbi:unnamed protein product [Parnassius apollo]|uniref:(apollo) hypothetical protein n=1 Tax=Parnassius apollo TaxID=110799 RepID=A0A8S3X3I4_PARAO|nr:unnamed protein product [Parnassius apollo]
MTDSTEVEVTYVSQRNKRRREEADENSDMLTFKNEILSIFIDLKVTMKEIKEQNIKLQESVYFTLKKYDEIIDKMQKMEENIKEDKSYICLLEAKIDQQERQTRNNSQEIPNIPKIIQKPKKTCLNLILKSCCCKSNS